LAQAPSFKYSMTVPLVSVVVEPAIFISEGGLGHLRHYVYPLTVSGALRTIVPWTVSKKFDEIAALNDSLRTRFPTQLSAFPKKRHVSQLFKFDSESEYLESIRTELQLYFDSVVAVPEILDDPDVQEFLELNTARARAALATARMAPLVKAQLAAQKLEQVRRSGTAEGVLSPEVEPNTDGFRAQLADLCTNPEGDHVYTITIRSSGGFAWSLSKSDAQFIAFHDDVTQLAMWRSCRGVPPFPKKAQSRFWRSEPGETLHAKRLKDLEDYLNGLLCNAALCSEAKLRDFLQIDAHLAEANRANQGPSGLERCCVALQRLIHGQWSAAGAPLLDSLRSSR